VLRGRETAIAESSTSGASTASTTRKPGENTTEIIDPVRQINELTKRETAVIHAMASLPEPERVKFWHEQFAPLAAEEHALREQLRVAGQGTPPGGRVQ